MPFPQSSHAYADMQRPSPWYICDRCGFRRMKDTSTWQYDWRGNNLANIRLLVCTETCNDDPQPQLRPILVGPDPIPVRDARPGWAATQMGFTEAVSPLELVCDEPPGYPRPPQPPVPPVPPPITGTLENYGGFLAIINGNYPESEAGLAVGDLYAPSGLTSSYIYVVPGFTYEPGAAVFFGAVTAAQLIMVGGFSLPQSDPQVLNQIWNNNDVLMISSGPSPGSPLMDSAGNVMTDSSGNVLFGSSPGVAPARDSSGNVLTDSSGNTIYGSS